VSTSSTQAEASVRTEVEPNKIESALSARWRKIAEAEQRAHGKPTTRAVLWNVIFSGDAAVTRTLVDELVSESPARAIVLSQPKEGDGKLHTYVEQNFTRHGASSVGADEVTIEVGGDSDEARRSLERVPSIVRSVLVPDALTSLAWIGTPPPAEHVTRQLVGEVDRVILDSRRLPDDLQGGERALESVLAMYHRHPHLELADLAWLGISPLRGLTAALFDPPFDPRPILELDEVVVTSGVQGAQARGLLMLGWLGSRLGWTEPRPDGDPAARAWVAERPDGGEVRMRVEVGEAGAKHGVRKLELSSGDQRWVLERDADKIEVRAPGLPVRQQPARSHSLAERIGEALGRKGRDKNYLDALKFAVELVRAGRK